MKDKRANPIGITLTEVNLVQLIQTLKTSEYIFEKNYEELTKKINSLENCEERFGAKASLEVERLLHNFVAACFSFEEHTYCFLDKIKAMSSAAETKSVEAFYSEQAKSLKANVHIKFLQEYRNHVQHVEPPHVPLLVKVRETGRMKIVLGKEALLHYKKWDKGVKEYLNNQSEIEIRKEIEEYHAEILRFYKNVFKRISMTYKNKMPGRYVAEFEAKQLYGDDAEIF